MNVPSELRALIRREEPLSPYTWYKIGGPAEFFAELTSIEDLGRALTWAKDNDLPFRLLGAGSNLLVRDEIVPGIVVKLAGPVFRCIDVSDLQVNAGAGASLENVISTSVRQGLAGLETLTGIPGTIGGAIVANAGGHYGDISQFLVRLRAIDHNGQLREISRADIRFEYRSTSLPCAYVVSATFSLKSEDRQEIQARRSKILKHKRSSQPVAARSSGCIFKNPRGISAGALISFAGLAGKRIGGAKVSNAHANFIEAGPDATSSDVHKLIDLMHETVLRRHNVDLQPEIIFW